MSGEPSEAPSSLPPDFVWAPLVPELLVTDIAASLAFWCGLCGFAIAYAREEDRFAYLQREGAQFMLEEIGEGRHWITGPLERPFGRGLNLQIAASTVAPILAALKAAEWPLYMDVEDKWYRAGTMETGVRQFLVQDPDGYLLRFSEGLGLRPCEG